jgi:hypothetical protein
MAKLEGNKWLVQNVKGQKGIEIVIQDQKQSVQIFKADDSLITVKGKCTTISVDGSKKTAVIFESARGAEPNAEAVEVAATVTGCQAPRASGSHAVEPTPPGASLRSGTHGTKRRRHQARPRGQPCGPEAERAIFRNCSRALRRKAPWVQLRTRFFREDVCKAALPVRCA